MTSLCLTMIVRDEDQVIERCLDSVVPIITDMVVHDTGSKDGTFRKLTNWQPAPRVILKHLAKVLWENFGYNRSRALENTRNWVGSEGYSFMIDADEELWLPEGYQLPELTADAYSLEVHFGDITYQRTCIFANRLPWRYEGVLHEYPTVTGPHKVERLVGPRIIVHTDGARSKDPEKYMKDANLLERALVDDPKNPRNIFYLAQSYRDAGQIELARTVYQTRVELGGWEEEVWYSLYEIGRLTERMGFPTSDICNAYLTAYQYRPTRAESLYQLTRYYRQQGEFSLAFLFAQRAVTIPRPYDLLFVDTSVYSWRCLDEVGILGYWVKEYREGQMACERLLKENNLPSTERSRVETNLSFYTNLDRR